MRCPKCGYISFDHLDNCLKCGKEIKKAADALHGTVFNVAPPSFLKFEASESEESSDFADQFEGDIDMDTIDPDLDILLDDDDGGIEADGLGELGGLTDDDDFEISTDLDDDQDDDISIDFDQFEDADLDEADDEGAADIDLDLPDELTDISDLEQQVEEPVAQAVEETSDSFDDLGMDDFDLNLDIGGLDEEETVAEVPPVPPAAPAAAVEEDELSLDLDLSFEEDAPAAEKPSADMDEDLNFDLDLGGLSLDK